MERKPSQADQPILITGASTGIGNHLARTLAERGLTVYAAARKEADLAELQKIENVVPVQLDVRQPEQVRAAVGQVLAAGKGLYGLVNNAGVGELGLLAGWSDEDLFGIFDINLFGVHRLTNACLDLLVAASGRIVNIGSQGGMLSKKYYGPYTMTKHALENYTETLRQELEPYGVGVSIIQPGGVVSKIGENSLAGTLRHFRNVTGPLQQEAEMVLAALTEPQAVSDEGNSGEESETNRKPSSPQIVTEAVLDALFSPKPKLHYLVGTKWEGDRVIHALLEKLVDENDNPRHNYSRDELISLLDQHIALRKP